MKILLLFLLFTTTAAADKGLIINTVIYIESKGNVLAYNMKEDAVGLLQIRPIMVKEVNRIAGYRKYLLEDRTNWERSIEMFIDYQNHYNPSWDEEKACRLWNGGPSGMRKKSTKKYYRNYKLIKKQINHGTE